jgi:hypothetical protein
VTNGFTTKDIRSLIDVNEGALFIRLWKGILRNRLEKLWRDFDHLKTKHPNITIDKIKRVNTDRYDQFSSRETIERSVAWRRFYILDGIDEFISGLRILNENEEIEKQTKLLDVVSNLEKPILHPTTDRRKIDKKLFWELVNDARKQSTDQLNTWEHWALAYTVRGGCGDDAFDYFKAWAVSKGQPAFDAIKSLRELEAGRPSSDIPPNSDLFADDKITTRQQVEIPAVDFPMLFCH